VLGQVVKAGATVMKGKITVEGYLYFIPYCGDGILLTKKRIELPRNERDYNRFRDELLKERDDAVDLLLLLNELEGRKVRITIEVVD